MYMTTRNWCQNIKEHYVPLRKRQTPQQKKVDKGYVYDSHYITFLGKAKLYRLARLVVVAPGLAGERRRDK